MLTMSYQWFALELQLELEQKRPVKSNLKQQYRLIHGEIVRIDICGRALISIMSRKKPFWFSIPLRRVLTRSSI